MTIPQRTASQPPRERRPYAAPVLTDYGDMKTLTTAGGTGVEESILEEPFRQLCVLDICLP
jgi:hypothetical protein